MGAVTNRNTVYPKELTSEPVAWVGGMQAGVKPSQVRPQQ